VFSSRPVSWVSSVLYGAVLLAGGYAGLAGLGSTRPALFVGGIALLFALDAFERRRYPTRTPPAPAAALLAARLALFVLVAVADGSGMSRVLFLLLPFAAYFTFGRVVSIALGVACAGLVAVGFSLTIPRWYAQAEQVSDLLMFCVGLVLTIAMAAIASKAAALSAAAERNRLARDIHDGLGHHLTAIAVLLDKAAAFRDRDPAVADRAIEDAHRSARRALDDVRRSVRTLRVEAAPFRLSSALDELVRDADDGQPSVTVDVTGDESRYPTGALTALYRAAQEGITNARRHARARRVSVDVHCDALRARLVVADDGCGFPPEREGYGLLGMRERVQLAGGSVEVDSGPGHGTRLTVEIPHRTDR
jgi:signal transduction histidine kinase